VKYEGKTQAQVDAEAKKAKAEAELASAKSEAAALNLDALRPLIAIAAGTATDEDIAKLKEIDGMLGIVRGTIRAKTPDLGG